MRCLALNKNAKVELRSKLKTNNLQHGMYVYLSTCITYIMNLYFVEEVANEQAAHLMRSPLAMDNCNIKGIVNALPVFNVG